MSGCHCLVSWCWIDGVERRSGDNFGGCITVYPNPDVGVGKRVLAASSVAVHHAFLGFQCPCAARIVGAVLACHLSMPIFSYKQDLK